MRTHTFVRLGMSSARVSLDSSHAFSSTHPSLRRRPLGLVAAGAPLLSGSADVDDTKPALSYGKAGCGRLEGGVALPCKGPGYEAFTSAACALGRNYLHPLVVDTVVDAYTALHAKDDERVWQYGEMGFREGGRLDPHRTHQNGRSADFFVPMVDEQGRPTKLPISPLQKFGYGLELDAHGRLGELRVDFAALGAHLLALEEAGKKHGVRIERVILTPDFHGALFRATPELKRMRARFMKREAWVRHDEHYHVDFTLPKHLTRPLDCKRR